MVEPIQIVVVGGGFGGMYCARRLQRRLRGGDAEVTVVNPENYMLYTPLLPEAASGLVESRHVVVPLRRVLGSARLRVGTVTDIDLDARTCTYRRPSGDEQMLSWDRLVLAPGSVSRLVPVPGLAEHARGFKSLPEAIYLRNHVLEQLELADASDDAEERAVRLTFVVVGAGYAGVELVAELQALVVEAIRAYPGLRPSDTRWVLADVAPKVLPELGGDLSGAALGVLRGRGIEVRLQTTVEEVRAGWLRFSDGEELRTCTFVWTAGVSPDPLVAKIGLATDKRGRVVVDEHLATPARADVFALGDAAAVPIHGQAGRPAPPTAQHALRQARRCGDNVAASLGRGGRRPFTFRGLGLLVNLGDHYGVGRVLGVPVSGRLGWMLTRTYHLLMLPTWGRRLRVGLDWAVAGAMPRDIVELGSLGHPGPLTAEDAGR
jgi:NADH:ubiquinone reductase (H+-translocating)